MGFFKYLPGRSVNFRFEGKRSVLYVSVVCFLVGATSQQLRAQGPTLEFPELTVDMDNQVKVTLRRPARVAATPDGRYLCVIRASAAVADPPGMWLVSTETNQVVGTVISEETGGVAGLIMATDPEGDPPRCYMAVTSQSGGTQTGTPNRLEVATIVEGDPVEFRLEEPILLLQTTSFGPIGIDSSPGPAILKG